MSFIKTSDPITLECESGEIFRISPLGGSVLIEIEPNSSEPSSLPKEESEKVSQEHLDQLYAEGMESQKYVENWDKEGGFAKPEFQRNKDWISEDELEDNEDEHLKKEKGLAMSSWPLP